MTILKDLTTTTSNAALNTGTPETAEQTIARLLAENAALRAASPKASNGNYFGYGPTAVLSVVGSYGFSKRIQQEVREAIAAKGTGATMAWFVDTYWPSKPGIDDNGVKAWLDYRIRGGKDGASIAINGMTVQQAFAKATAALQADAEAVQRAARQDVQVATDMALLEASKANLTGKAIK